MAHLARLLSLPLLALAGAQPLPVQADLIPEPVGQWWFWPQYTLPLRAANYPGPRPAYPRTDFAPIDGETQPLLLHGEAPTERIARLLAPEDLPRHTFSAEFWVIDHVNQPVGALAALRGPNLEDPPAWLLAYHHRRVLFTLRTRAHPEGVALTAETGRGWKSYWRHVVATYDGSAARLYLNGELAATDTVRGPLLLSDTPELEAAAYLRHEPAMQLGNLLRQLRLYPVVLNAEQIVQRFQHLQSLVEEGILFDDRFHFTAGPSLNYPTQTSIRLVWETDRSATADLHYGRQIPLDQVHRVPIARRLHQATLEGLEPETNYFYEVIARDADGHEIRSGPLTFKTAVRDDSAFSFVVMGDTEARPHINDRLAQAIWGERPHFVINVGDLTDGGQRPHKFEWNLEYFLGLNQLLGRIPILPVPGNGESDLYWYLRYHALPPPHHYYSFRFGNAEFFLLDSNRPLGPGSDQYAWLDEQLAHSSARWKVVAHHHPSYTSDEDDYGNTWQGGSELGDANVRGIVPLYEKHGVDLVFFGHLHTYERSWPIAGGRVDLERGVRYIQTGGAGGNLEDFAPTRNWFTVKVYRGHHYCLLNVFADHLSFQMFDVDGRLRDAFELHNSP